MADDGAARTRRWKLHKAGDHSECKGCDARKTSYRAPVSLIAGDSGEDRVIDAGSSLRALARRLEAAHEQDPANSNLARELRATLLVLAGSAPRPEDAVDRIRREYEETVRGL